MPFPAPKPLVAFLYLRVNIPSPCMAFRTLIIQLWSPCPFLPSFTLPQALAILHFLPSLNLTLCHTNEPLHIMFPVSGMLFLSFLS